MEDPIPRPLLAPAMALLLLACTTKKAPLTSTEVKACVFAESVPQELFDGFTEATGVKTHVATYETNEELVALLRARPTACDLVMPSDYTVDQLIHEDALRPLDLAQIPEYDNIAPAFLAPYFDPGGLVKASRGPRQNEKFSLPWLWGTTGIAYDETKVSPAPSSWADLWAPAWAGRLVLLDDTREMLGIGLIVLGYSKNDTDPAHLEAARAKVAELAKGAVALDANTTENYLISGEAVIGVAFSGNATLAMRGNPNIRYVLPQEGAGIWFDNLAIPARAPHPDTATALIDHLLKPESGVVVIRALPFSNPNDAALDRLKETDPTLYASYTRDPATTPPQDALSGALPVKSVGPEGQAAFEAAWAQVLASRGVKP